MSQYGFNTTGKEIVTDLSANVKGRTFLVTGPSEGGIGAQTAIDLAYGSPSTILLLGRSIAKIQPTIDSIHAINSSITTKFISVELSKLASVRAAAKTILDDSSIPKIDVVINNAAIMIHPYELSVDGFELQFATNFLSHFLLTNLIMPKIIAAGPGAVIVNVSSVGHKFGNINWGNTDYDKGSTYKEWAAYGQAKTGNALFSTAINDKLNAKGIKAWSLNPGSIVTNLQKYMTTALIEEATKRYAASGKSFPVHKSLEQGCSTTLRAALDDTLELKDGWSSFLEDCQVASDPEVVKRYACDSEAAERLWKMAEEMVGEKFAY